MPVFEKKYIYCLWDDTLASKEAFFAEDVMNLRLNVEHNDNDYKMCYDLVVTKCNRSKVKRLV